MSNIKVVKIDKVIEKSKKKTKKNRINPELEYLKNIIRNKKEPSKTLSNILTKNEEIEKLLAKKKFSKIKKTQNNLLNEINTNKEKVVVPQKITAPQKVKTPEKVVVPQKVKTPEKVVVPQKVKKPEKVVVPQKVKTPEKKINKSNPKEKNIFKMNKNIKTKSLISKSKSNQKNINLINSKLKELKSKKKKKALPKNVLNLKPATKKDLDKFFKKIEKKSKKKKIISANKKAPSLKRGKKSKSKNNLQKKSEKNIITNNPYNKIVEKIIKNNSSKINSKEIDELSREKLISKLFNLDLINKDTSAPTNILQDIYKIYKITHKSINIKK